VRGYFIRRLWLFSVLMIAVMPTVSFAQFMVSSSLSGSVTDGKGALPGVRLVLSGVGTPQVRVSDALGRFRFPDLAPGAYTVSASLEGFEAITITGIRINVGRNTEINLKLTPLTDQGH